MHTEKGRYKEQPLQDGFPLPWKTRGAATLLLSACFVPLCLFSSLPAVAQDDLRTGVQLFEAGRLGEAREFFETARRRQPSHTGPPFYLGRIAFAEQNYQQAITWFAQAVDGERCNADYHLWLGRAYGHRARQVSLFRKPVLARQVSIHFEKAVGCDPTHVAAHWDLMEYYLKAPRFLGGSRKKAAEQVAIITRLDPAEGQKARRFIAEAAQ